LLYDIIARELKKKIYILPNNSGEATSEEQQTDLCIICQVSSLAALYVRYQV